MVRRRRRQVKAERSTLEKKVEGWLTEQGIPFQSQYPISLCHTDIYFPLTKTAVELNGCFWHCCGDCYPDGGEHKRQRVKDMRRYKVFWNQGHKVLVIWEHEVNQNFEDVKRKLLHAAGIAIYGSA
jgi:very-short-patch-repair endonuclease